MLTKKEAVALQNQLRSRFLGLLDEQVKAGVFTGVVSTGLMAYLDKHAATVVNQFVDHETDDETGDELPDDLNLDDIDLDEITVSAQEDATHGG